MVIKYSFTYAFSKYLIKSQFDINKNIICTFNLVLSNYRYYKSFFGKDFSMESHLLFADKNHIHHIILKKLDKHLYTSIMILILSFVFTILINLLCYRIPLIKTFIFLSLFVLSCNNIPSIPAGCSNFEYYLTYEVPSGNIKEENVTYQNGIKYSGKCSVFYGTGELASIQQYLDGKDHGKWTFYYINGQVETVGSFKWAKGLVHGSIIMKMVKKVKSQNTKMELKMGMEGLFRRR